MKNLYVFQRTPNYSIPSNNGPMDKEIEADIKSRYAEFRKENWSNGFGIAGIADEALIAESDIDEVNFSREDLCDHTCISFLPFVPWQE